MADYRQPITLKDARYLTEGFAVGGAYADIEAEIDISTEDGKMFMHWLKTGLACNWCYETFPAVPSAATLGQFEDRILLYPINIDVQRDRIRDGACHVCGMKNDPSVIEKQIREEALQLARSMYDKLKEDDE